MKDPGISGTVLVLNASYEPLCIVSAKRATCLVLTDKAETVTEGTGVLHSALTSFVIPSVVRLSRFVKVPYRNHTGMSRRAIFARDGSRCAYCKGPAETIDHVYPRSRGGKWVWENVVAACGTCNHRKGDKTLEQMGWKLDFVPKAPSGVSWRVVGTKRRDPRWDQWLAD